MSAVDWAALLVSISAISAAFAGAVRWMVKHYLSELHKNGGTSLRDAVDRLEVRIDDLYKLVAEK